MKKRAPFVIVLIVGFLALIFCPANAHQTVIGRDNPAVDVVAVQAAVEKGGEILLRGTFDFDDKGRVHITKDVKIVGETNGKPMTKIKGGFWAFHSPLPSKLPLETPGPNIIIQSIHFDGALWAPIYLAYARGATITSNKITHIRPMPSPISIFGKLGLNYQQGIICYPRYADPGEPGKYQPGLITGSLIIADNEIEMSNEEPTKTMAQGVIVIWTTGINAQILRNTVYNCTRNAIEAIDNFLGEPGGGIVVIKDNKIVTPQIGLPVPTPYTPNGIMAGWFLDMTGGVDPKRNTKYFIINNSIRLRGQTSFGIAAFTDGAVIETNAVVAETSKSSILSLVGSNGYMAHNALEGTGNNGTVVMPWGPLKASNNVLVGNDFKQFKALISDVSFRKGANNNLAFGSSGTVDDQGSGNQIIGLKPISK
jgi:hypothetical protein